MTGLGLRRRSGLCTEFDMSTELIRGFGMGIGMLELLW
jgi:hypothetical protein